MTLKTTQEKINPKYVEIKVMSGYNGHKSKYPCQALFSTFFTDTTDTKIDTIFLSFPKKTIKNDKVESLQIMIL